MKEQRILITGASGCVGQYTTNWFYKNTDYELFLWLRDPNKLKSVNPLDSRINLLIGDLREPELHKNVLSTITHVIHTATAWGDPERAHQVNFVAVKDMLKYFDPKKIQKIIYFSTASILNENLDPLEEAFLYGTEYIYTKAKCLRELESHQLSNKIIAVFPTLVFGGKCSGEGIFPRSYLTEGLQEANKWLWLARWFRGYSKFHFIHAADIAFICGHLCTNKISLKMKNEGKGIPRLVLGQQEITIDSAIKTLLKWNSMRRTLQFPLWGWIIKILLKVLPIQLSKWDRFSIKQRHFIHKPVTSPEDFGGESHAKTLKDVLYASDLPKKTKN